MIVVDCSAVVDALTAVDGSDDLRELLSRKRMCAPSLLDYEVVAALRGLTRGGSLNVARANDAMADFDDLAIIRWESADALRRRSFELRDSISAYDASYVVLAEALECPLVTRDRRLQRAASGVVETVVL
ncbi:MAG: type II toxin-antitoxin system VapC family toxin [Propionibacteriales bacterium]|nr:type II toxin-antitoxin system VapC family toxin [Propionibacteriales bacterium]